MDAPPPVPPPGQSAFPSAPLKCSLPDVTGELLHELDTDVIPAITNTSFTLDLRNTTSLSTGTALPASAGRLSVEIADATYNGSPCYQVMASLLLRAGGSVQDKTSVQVIANVSTQLDTLRESRVVTIGGKVRHTRNVWGMGITAPGSTRVSSAVPGASSRSIAGGSGSGSGSKPVSATQRASAEQQQQESASLDEYLNTVPEDTTPSQESEDAQAHADELGTSTVAPLLSDPTQPASTGLSSPSRTSSARPRSARPASGSSRPSTAPPRPHYLVQHQSVTLAGSPDDADDLVTFSSTHVIDHGSCPGLLFSGSQLIFLLLVALHVQSTGLSVPEVFVTHAYADNPDQPTVVTLTSDPVRPQVVCGLARKLAGVRVDKAVSAAKPPPHEAAYDLVGHESQWYFAPWVVDDEQRPRSAADALGDGASGGLELVAVLRVAGAHGIVTDPKAVVGGHPADDGELGGAIEVQSMYYDLKAEEEQNLDSVLHTRPQLTAMLSDFMRAVLVKKPTDVYAFARDYFLLPQQ